VTVNFVLRPLKVISMTRTLRRRSDRVFGLDH